jgi:hypothetical protein
MTRALIVASGPSAKRVRRRDIPHHVTVIGVNGVVDWIDGLDYWFSLDASPINQSRLRKKRLPCTYVTCGPRWPAPSTTHYQRIDALASRPDVCPHPADSPEWWLWRWAAVPGVCKRPNTINTGNSAWGALQLAWHLGKRDVAIVGVDADDSERVGGGHSQNLSHLPLLFNSALDGSFARLVNCGNMKSQLTLMSLRGWLSC